VGDLGDNTAWGDQDLMSGAGPGRPRPGAVLGRVTLVVTRTASGAVRTTGSVAAGAVDRVLLRSTLVERVIDGLIEARVAERVVDRVLASPATERLVIRTLERPEMERLLAQVLDSPAVDRVMTSVLERVADSPEVRRAVAQQSAGLADEVAEQVRTRAAAGDDAAERLARRLLRRGP
jgi:hypothetical protein